MSPSLFSVVVCTHNRAALLPQAIASLRAQTCSPETYEIIVVDNASTDDTRETVDRLQRSDGHPIRYVNEARLGLSHARNKGAEVARAPWVAYVDDDSIARSDWLQAFSSIAKDNRDSVWALAGRIDLRWTIPRPVWLAPELDWILSFTDGYGDEARFLAPPKGPLGGNLVVRRTVLERIGGFDSRVGRRGGKLLSNDELDLAFRIWERGGQILYVPTAVVDHLVYARRLRRDVILRRIFWQSASDIVVDQIQTPLSRRQLLVHAVVGVYQSSLDAGRWVRALWKRDEREAFTQLFNLFGRLGRTRQFAELALKGTQ